jgi:hypothetical protein
VAINRVGVIELTGRLNHSTGQMPMACSRCLDLDGAALPGIA